MIVMINGPFGVGKSQQYIPQFADPRFQIHIDTEKETPEAIAQIVLDQITP